jgi:hypothetical protein
MWELFPRLNYCLSRFYFALFNCPGDTQHMQTRSNQLWNYSLIYVPIAWPHLAHSFFKNMNSIWQQSIIWQGHFGCQAKRGFIFNKDSLSRNNITISMNHQITIINFPVFDFVGLENWKKKKKKMKSENENQFQAELIFLTN